MDGHVWHARGACLAHMRVPQAPFYCILRGTDSVAPHDAHIRHPASRYCLLLESRGGSPRALRALVTRFRSARSWEVVWVDGGFLENTVEGSTRGYPRLSPSPQGLLRLDRRRSFDLWPHAWQALVRAGRAGSLRAVRWRSIRSCPHRGTLGSGLITRCRGDRSAPAHASPADPLRYGRGERVFRPCFFLPVALAGATEQAHRCWTAS